MEQFQALLHLLARFAVIVLWIVCIVTLFRDGTVEEIVLRPLTAALSAALSAAYVYRRKKKHRSKEENAWKQLDRLLADATVPLYAGIVFALAGRFFCTNQMFSLSWGTALVSQFLLLWIDPVYIRLLCPRTKISLESGLFALVQVAITIYLFQTVSMPASLLFIAGTCFAGAKKNASLFTGVMAVEIFASLFFALLVQSGSAAFALIGALAAGSLLTTFAGGMTRILWNKK